jgi:hypothetical protein
MKKGELTQEYDMTDGTDYKAKQADGDNEQSKVGTKSVESGTVEEAKKMKPNPIIPKTNEESDSDDGFDVKMVETVMKVQRPVVPVDLDVSGPFVNNVDGIIHYVVFLGKSKGYSPFYLKGDYIRTLMYMRAKILENKRIKSGEDDTETPPIWIDTISEYGMRHKPHHIDDKHARAPTGSRISINSFILSYDRAGSHDLVTDLRKIVTEYLQPTLAGKPPKDIKKSVGSALLTCMDNNPLNGGGRIKDRLLAKYGTPNGNVEKTIKGINDDLKQFYGGGFDVKLGISLDKYLADWDIKQFVESTLKKKGWADLDEDETIGCYAQYPKERKELPDWHGITPESLY